MQPDGIDRRHADQPADIHPQRADPGLHRVVEFQDLAETLVTGLPFGRQHERPLAAIDQLHAEMLLHAMDRLGGRRLADVVDRGAAGETLVLDDITEDAEVSMFIRLSYHKIALMINACE